MISDITLGQFFPGNSFLHRLDPRTKIILAMLFIFVVFFAATPVAFLTLLLFTIIMIFMSRISLKTILKGIKPIILILVMTSLLNIFMTVGEGEPLFAHYFIKIYTEGIVRAAFMAARVTILIIGTSLLLTYTTSPISLTDGIERLLSPFKKIGLPVHSFAMMMSIAIRFIPTLIEETEKIMNAQKSRGANFSTGGIIKRAKALIPLLIPLFVSAFKRADELATAMECRCYRGDVNRTKMVELKYKWVDLAGLLVFLILTAAVVFANIAPSVMHLSGGIFDIMFYVV